MLLAVDYWLALCHDCHQRVTLNPAASRKEGTTVKIFIKGEMAPNWHHSFLQSKFPASEAKGCGFDPRRVQITESQCESTGYEEDYSQETGDKIF